MTFLIYKNGLYYVPNGTVGSADVNKVKEVMRPYWAVMVQRYLREKVSAELRGE